MSGHASVEIHDQTDSNEREVVAVSGDANVGVEPCQDRTSLSRDDVFELLHARRRRHAVRYLRQRGRSVELRELSTHLAAWENDLDPADVEYDERIRVYTALYQFHLPKLDEYGVVDFDPVSGEVTLSDTAAELEAYLEVVPGDEIPWATYYLGLGSLGIGALTAHWVGVPPFDAVGPTWWAIGIAAILATSAAVHGYRDRQRPGEEGPLSV